jgi:hypothetical protein
MNFFKSKGLIFPAIGFVASCMATAGLHAVTVEWWQATGGIDWDFAMKFFLVAWLVFSFFLWLIFTGNRGES